MSEIVIDQNLHAARIESGLILGPLAIRNFIRIHATSDSLEVLHEQPTLFDIITGRVVVGDKGVRAHINEGGKIEELRKLRDLLADNDLRAHGYKFPSEQYHNWLIDDCINYGRWLLKLDGIETPVTSTVLRRANDLGLGPIVNFFRSPTRFKTIANYQRRLEQKRIRQTLAFEDMDVIDLLILLKNIGDDEEAKPTLPILKRRRGEGKLDPPLNVLVKGLGPLPRAYERAGFFDARYWYEARHLEWASMFIMANRRPPAPGDLRELSRLNGAPDPKTIRTIFGGQAIYKERAMDVFENRASIKLESIKKEIESRELPIDLVSISASETRLIRNAARFKVIDGLLPTLNQSEKLGLCAKDIIEIPFVNLLQNKDPRATIWMVEAAARDCLVYPEIFTNGDFIKSLKINNQFVIPPTGPLPQWFVDHIEELETRLKRIARG